MKEVIQGCKVRRATPVTPVLLARVVPLVLKVPTDHLALRVSLVRLAPRVPLAPLVRKASRVSRVSRVRKDPLAPKVIRV